MKRILIVLIGLAALALATDARRPNIILIFTDDQGYNDLGCFGSTKIKTPNIDRMAAEGVRLTSFYAQPVCCVSRSFDDGVLPDPTRLLPIGAGWVGALPCAQSIPPCAFLFPSWP